MRTTSLGGSGGVASSRFWLPLLGLLALGCSPTDTRDDTATTTTPVTGTRPPAHLACADATQHRPDRRSAKPSAAQGCWLPTGVDDVSPSIQVSRDGVLFIARSKGGVLRSDDDGEHWSDVAVPPVATGDSHEGGIHGFVHIDPRTDRIYYVTNMGAASCGGGKGAVVSWSDDLGDTWTGTTVACDTYDWGKVVTGPAPDGADHPSAIYFLGVGLRPIGGQRFVYRSLDGGATWERMADIAAATTEAGVGVAAADGTVYFDYPEFTGFDPTRLQNTTYPWVPENECRQMVAVTEDHGVTWRQEPVPGSKACGLLYGQQRVAVDEAGTLYVVWVDDTDAKLYLSTSADRARTWSDPVDVTAPGRTFALNHANVVAGEAGHVVIASLQTSVEERPPNHPAYPVFAAGDYTADAVLTESWDADDASPSFTTVDLDADGDPTLAEGQSSNEANAYLAMSADGVGWAVFSRRSKDFGSPGSIAAARLYSE